MGLLVCVRVYVRIVGVHMVLGSIWNRPCDLRDNVASVYQ